MKDEDRTILSRFRFGAFDAVNYGFMALLIVLSVAPFWYIFVVSVSTEAGYYADSLHVLPKTFTLETYAYIFHNRDIFRSFQVSLFVTAMGTVLSLLLTSLGAYPLSRHSLKGRGFFFRLILVTMFFNGGLIPWYVTVNSIGLRNSIFAFIVPSAINTFNLILMKNNFSSMPEALIESAKMDGYNDLRILFRIVLPVSMPIVTTIGLFYAVYYWNDFFMPMLFASSRKNYTLALVLRNMVVAGSASFATSGMNRQDPTIIRAGIIFLSMLPILAIYPFVQRYFVKGIMLGSLKE
jgi:ABC-type sugar transport system, permease component